MQAEVGGMWPQAQEHLEPPEAGGGKEGFSPTASRRSVALLTTLILDFWPPELRENKFLLFYAIQAVVVCFDSHRKLRQDPHFHTYT